MILSAAARRTIGLAILAKQEDCGTGAGGFKPGNDCAEGHGRPSTREAEDRKVKVQGDSESRLAAISEYIPIPKDKWEKLTPAQQQMFVDYIQRPKDPQFEDSDFDDYDEWAAQYDPDRGKLRFSREQADEVTDVLLGGEKRTEIENPERGDFPTIEEIKDSLKDTSDPDRAYKLIEDIGQGRFNLEGDDLALFDEVLDALPTKEGTWFRGWDDTADAAKALGEGWHEGLEPGKTLTLERNVQGTMMQGVAWAGGVGITPEFPDQQIEIGKSNRTGKEPPLKYQDAGVFFIFEDTNAPTGGSAMNPTILSSHTSEGTKVFEATCFLPTQEYEVVKVRKRRVYKPPEYVAPSMASGGRPELAVLEWDPSEVGMSWMATTTFVWVRPKSASAKSFTKDGDDCGTGAGGFKEDNTCAVGHGAQSSDGINQEEKDEDLSVDERLERHLRNSGNLANFATRLAEGELTSDDYYDLQGYIQEQMYRAEEEGLDDEYSEWEQFDIDLRDAVYLEGLIDEHGELDEEAIPRKSEPWPSERRELPDFTNVPEAIENRQIQLKLLNTNMVYISDEDSGLEFEVPMADHIREMMDPVAALEGRKPTIHIDAGDLRQVLFDEAFLPFGHPDVPKSTNANTSHREDIEWRMGLGSSPTTGGAPWHDRPVYGAFEASHWDETSHAVVGSFGNVQVNLKDSVLDRATVTFGDSGRVHEDREDFGNNKISYPAPVSYRRVMDGSASKDELVAAHSSAWWNSKQENGDDRDSWTEFQIWGGVTIDDIESVVVSPSVIEEDRQKGGRLARMLAEKGIRVEVADNDWKAVY